MKKLSFIFFIPFLAAFFPYVVVHFFDSPLLHGVFSVDVFYLLLAFSLPYGKILQKGLFAIAVVLYAAILNSIDAYAVAGVYLLIIIASAWIPRKEKFLLPTYIVFALIFFVADCGNFFYSTFMLTLPDVWGLAKFFWWGPVLFLLVPLLQVLLELLFVRKILWGENRLELSHIVVFLILTLSLALNFGVNKLQHRQPIMDFTVQTWLWQLCTPGIIGQNPYLQEDIKRVFPIWDKAIPAVVDFTKPTVVVLVESYGVNKSVAYTDSLLAPFSKSGSSFVGLFLRNAAHTQGAEWEDFGMPGGNIRGVPIPERFKNNNLQTWFLHGYDGSFYNRKENYDKFGFDSLLFKNDLAERGLSSCNYGFAGICDSAIMVFIDSMLTDSVPKFVYWTTLDAHPPYEFADALESSSVCKSLNLSNVDCTYFTLQQNTARRLARLAAKHPEYRFVIRGDHRPMGSFEQTRFVQSFYFRWVPIIILN